MNTQYPPFTSNPHSFSDEERRGDDISRNQLDRIHNQLTQTTNELNAFVRQGHDVEGNVKPIQPTRAIDIVETHDLVGDGTADLDLVNIIDSRVDLIGHVTVDGDPVFLESAQPPVQAVAATGSVTVADNSLVLDTETLTITDATTTAEVFEFIADPVAALGSVEIDDTLLVVDGDTVVIGDGVDTHTFEFDDDAAVTGGNILVDINGLSYTDIAINLATAIEANLTITAALTDGLVDLVNDVAGIAGNVAITNPIDTNAAVTVVGMAGGVDQTVPGVGNIAVAIGVDADATALNLEAAIAGGGLDLATVLTLDEVGLTNNLETALGNVAITSTSAGLTLVGMSGGVDEVLPIYTYAYSDRTITFTPPVPTSIPITYSVYMNMAGVLDRLTDLVNGAGAALVAFADPKARLEGVPNVEEAIYATLDIIDSIRINPEALLRDGSVQLTADWLVNQRKETGTAIKATGRAILSDPIVTNDWIDISDGLSPVFLRFEFAAENLAGQGDIEVTAVPSVAATYQLTDTEGSTDTFEFYANGGDPSSVAPGNIPVELGGDAEGTADNIVQSVNLRRSADLLQISAYEINSTTVGLQQVIGGVAGNTAIPVTGTGLTATAFAGGLDDVPATSKRVSIGADINETSANLRDAINASGIEITAQNIEPSPIVDLTHRVPTGSGNVPMTTNTANITLTGMGGGQAGTKGDLCSRFTMGNLPPAACDGEVVVFEQLNGLLNDIRTLSSRFVRIDGQSTMTGPLRMGGNKVIEVLPGEDGTDAVNVDQLTEVQAGDDAFIPTLGRKHTTRAGQANITGPLGFTTLDIDDEIVPQDATLIASEEQDETADVHTIDGVPQPFKASDVVNKHYSDVEDGKLAVRIDEVEQELGISSRDGGCLLDLGGAGVDLTDGGRFEFNATASVTVAQEVIEGDLEVFVEGDLTIGAALGLTTTGGRLTLSCTGVLTVSADLTTDDGDITLRGATVVLDAAIDAGRAVVWIEDTAGLTLESGTIDAGHIRATGGAMLAGVSGMAWDVSGVDTYIVPDAALAGESAGNRPGPSVTDPEGRYAGLGGLYPTDTGFGNAGGGGGGGTGGADGGKGADSGGNPGAEGGPSSPYLRPAARRPHLFPIQGGGHGSPTSEGIPRNGGEAGGTIDIYRAGNAVLTGSTFTAEGGGGAPDGSNVGSGGGGGGAVRIVATGEITDGTISANGGDAGNDDHDGGCGAGGGAYLIGSAYTGTQTVSAVTGFGADNTGDGSTWDDTNLPIYTEEQIICEHLSGVW